MNIFKNHLLNLSRLLIAAILVVPALEVQARGGGQKPTDPCLRVDAVWVETDFFEHPAPECEGYDLCLKGDLKGTLNAEFWHYSSWSIQNLNDPHGIGVDTLNVGAYVQKIHTADGVIHTKGYGLYDDSTLYTEMSKVTGGTGKYEYATGHLVAYPDASKPALNYYGLPLNYLGRICTQ